MSTDTRLTTAFTAQDASIRMRAALAAGTDPRGGDGAGDISALIAQCAVEPDFFVRDMLTWALTRHPSADVVPSLLAELHSPTAQARSQALHTLSKIGEEASYPHITDDLLQDADDEVARTAWRAAAGLVPRPEAPRLAVRLAGQLGRGDRELRRSLTRAYLELGEDARDVLRAQANLHAAATLLLLDDPDLGFDAAEYAAAEAAQAKLD
ncbi:HEAT repeat domain-containing protein [Corynebacterium sp. AOP40-9SA-29]|uniref:HEAT repeat domain-containing protein n=1 Tax=Corynebacterium sp. AOP40-9SA-29 TaxID=3457677 RepID=UPI0040345EBC